MENAAECKKKMIITFFVGSIKELMSNRIVYLILDGFRCAFDSGIYSQSEFECNWIRPVYSPLAQSSKTPSSKSIAFFLYMNGIVCISIR